MINFLQKNYLILIGWVYYLVVNSLFIIKYGNRLLNSYELLIALFIYLVGVHLIFISVHRFRNHDKLLKYVTLSIISLFLLYSLYINISLDSNTIKVDRWSALNNSIGALLKGDYPYTAATHLNGRSSNLPGLLLIGLPFYFLGNVGFLQIVSFLLISVCTFQIFHKNWIQLIVILLFISTPANHWELIVKSDLVSNFALILVFLLWYQQKNSHQINQKPILIGILSTILFLTRFASIIPLGFLLLRDFFQSKKNVQFKFMATALFVFTLLWILVLYQAPSIEVIRNYNPIFLQSSQLPLHLSIICILVSLGFSLKANLPFQKILYSAFFLTLPVVLSFAGTIINSGLSNTLFGSYNDLSYLSIPLPFMIFGFAMAFVERSTAEEKKAKPSQIQ